MHGSLRGGSCWLLLLLAAAAVVVVVVVVVLLGVRGRPLRGEEGVETDVGETRGVWFLKSLVVHL